MRDEKEWTGSAQLAYVNQSSKASDGKIYLAVPQVYNFLPSGATFLRTHVVLFFENFPIDTRAAPDELGVMRVYLDHDRFTGVDEEIGLKDRLYEFNIIKGVPLRRFDGTSGGKWVQYGANFPGFEVATSAKNCQPDPTTTALLRCSAEVRIPLDNSAITKPDPSSSVLPGFGLLITDGQKAPQLGRVNAYPKGHNTLSNNPVGQSERRMTWQTILIGRPKGFPLKFMSWNIHRFKSDSLQEDFKYVTNASIGRFLALNDVVAIQEGWDSKAVEEILQHANIRRKENGLPPFNKYHPPQVVTPQKQKFLEHASSKILGENEVHGGTWIFSHLPAKAQGQWVFQDEGKPYCRGDDCFKAKGVQWVRLNLNPADGPAAKCNLDFKSEVLQGTKPDSASCPLSPSGDHYVDIFNTHLQANNSPVCTYHLDKAKYLLEGLLGDSIIEKFGLASLVKKLIDDEVSCWKPTESIREEQLRQFNAFIESVTPERDRPAILMGDFNINGRDTSDGEYKAMIDALRIGPEQTSGNPPSDIINPWQYDFEHDYDHGDVLRERSEKDAVFQGPIGTFITEKGGNFVTDNTQLAKDAGRVNGNERFDFVLIRPPFRPDAPDYKQARWVALRPEKDTDLWSSPWPGEKNPVIDPNQAPPPPPERFSDHKPVLSTIELTPLSQPPVYHPTWKHDWTYRITQANASGIKDCASGFQWLSEDCEYVDIYHLMGAATVVQTGSGLSFVPGEDKNTINYKGYGYCETQSVAAWPGHDCTHEWYLSGKHTSTSQISHDGSSEMIDYDTGSPDDGLLVLPKENKAARVPWVKTIWDAPLYKNRAQIMFFMANGWTNPDTWETWAATVYPEDSAPVGACTPYGIPFVCIENSFVELPPGEQF